MLKRISLNNKLVEIVYLIQLLIKMSVYIKSLFKPENENKLNEIIDEAFRNVDTDKSGAIDEAELEKIMVQITSDMGAEPPTKEDVKEVMEALDTDRSNSIEKQEFGELIKNILSALIEW